MANQKEDQLEDDNIISEGGASEGSLSPNGGTGAGDIKTKTIADIVAKLGSLGPDDLNGFKASIDQIGKEADPVPGGAEAKNRSSVETKPSFASTKGLVKEDLVNMFKSEDETLSEEFMENAITLFESAVTLRVADEVEQTQASIQEEADAAIEEMRTAMNERMDSYLDYVAEQYIENNAVEVENLVRAQISESFISDLRGLFEQHNLDMPESEIDQVASLQEQIDQLTESLNEVTAEKIGLAEELENTMKADVLANVMEGLTDTQKDKMVTLAEDIDFEDEEQFHGKMETIRENFFNKKEESDNGLILEEDEPTVPAEKKEATGAMGAYTSAISRSIKR